jgi:hypothetical protein
MSELESYKTMRGLLLERVALQEQQKQILARALEENDLKLPREYIEIERQLDSQPLDDLNRLGLELGTQPPAAKSEGVDPEPDAQPSTAYQPDADAPESMAHPEMPHADHDDSRSIGEGDDLFQVSESDYDSDDSVNYADEADTSFQQNMNDQWASVYGDENDREVDARHEYFDDQDGDSDEDSPANESTIHHDPSSPPAGEDNTIDRAFKFMDAAKQYDQEVGNPTRAPVRHGTQQPGGSPSARSPSPPLDDDEAGEETIGDLTFGSLYDYPNPDSDQFGPPPEESDGETHEDHTHARAHASHQQAPVAPMQVDQPTIDSTSSPEGQSSLTGKASHQQAPIAPMQVEQPIVDFVSSPEGQSSLTDQASHQPAPIAPMQVEQPIVTSTSSPQEQHQQAPVAPMQVEQPIVDFVSSPEGQSIRTGQASTKRARADSVESSEDDDQRAKRRKTEGKRPASAAVATSSPGRKRSRGTDDDGAQREQPSKRQRSAGADEGEIEATHQGLLSRADSVHAAQGGSAHAGSSKEAAADVPQAEPSTRALGHTDRGTVTTTQLHKLGKYKKGVPSRPWVFGFGFGEDYGLYVMSCPTKGCPNPDVFTMNPLECGDSNDHLISCHGDCGDGSHEDMVRKFCKQGMSPPPSSTLSTPACSSSNADQTSPISDQRRQEACIYPVGSEMERRSGQRV